MKINYSIVFVSDMQRSIAFYRDTLGLPVRFESAEWTEFETEDVTLALHIARPESAPETQLPAPGRCRPGFQVEDLSSFHARMADLDVPCLQDPKDVFGTLVAQYLDPDGLVIAVSEAPRK